MREGAFRAAVEFSNLFRCELVVEILDGLADFLEGYLSFLKGKFAELFDYLGRAHGTKLPPQHPHASGISPSELFRTPHSALRVFMIPREILKKIRQIEIRTNRIVTETLAGQYHSVFKGQGMNFDEVREYQPGDDVRAIDWNVTARMNHPFIKKFVE